MVERLAEIAQEHTLDVVVALERMVDLAAEGWAIHSWTEEARIVLEAGLASENAEARACAERVVHKLGAMRFSLFRDMLKTLPPTED